MLSFNSRDYSTHSAPRPAPSAFLRPAVVISTNADKGTVNIEWLDHPGTRQDVLLTPSGQGIFELPTLGSTVLVGFGVGFDAYILAYVPVGYRDLVGTPRGTGEEITADLKQLKVGEKMLVSYVDNTEESQSNQFSRPSTTGTHLHMSNTGDVLIKSADGDYWQLVRDNNIIVQNSMNYRAITDAGTLDFGVVKRASTISDKQSEDIIATSGAPLGSALPGAAAEDALTEFRLKVLGTADANDTTEPAIDDPLIEFVLGTKVSDDGEVVLTDGTHAKAAKKIMIQLKTKADQGFEFTVDEEGNLTINVKGDVKFGISEGNLQVDVDEGKEVLLGGDSGEPMLLGESFQKTFNDLVDYVNKLHYANAANVLMPLVTVAPVGTAMKSQKDDLAKKVKGE